MAGWQTHAVGDGHGLRRGLRRALPWSSLAGAGLCVALAAAACSSPSKATSTDPASTPIASTTIAPTPSTTTTTSSSSSSTTTTTNTNTNTTTAPPRAVTLAFGGDVYGQPPVRGVLERGENPLAAVAPLLRGADVAIVNLETSVGSSGAPRDKQFVFQAHPNLLAAIADAGVDVVSVANNHSFDHGLDGFLETLDNVAAAGLAAVGGGRDAAEAWAPAIVPVGGVEVAVLGVAVIGPEDDDRAAGDRPGTTNGRDRDALVAAIEAAKVRTPIVVVMVHWGAELARCPRPWEQDLAQRMLDAGASVVVGAHPHVLQARVAGNGQLVAYSIGNFVFAGRSEATSRTGVLLVTVEPDGRVRDDQWEPARIDVSGRPIPLGGEERDIARAAYADQPTEGPACAG
jgi:poly-gamma-glutamate capsule biosynthesis protein CapA/YwtB (metallophosphatase superfamily)